MRILYIAPHPLWPLTTGARLRDYHCAKQLAGHAEVTFVQICTAEELAQPVAHPADSGIAHVCSLSKGKSYTIGKILRGLAGPTPLTVLNYFSPQSANELAAIVTRHGPFDSVQIEGVHLSAYLPVLRAAMPDVPITADWHNIESELMWRYSSSQANPLRQIVARRTASLLERSEQLLVEQCAAHTVASDRERELLLQRFPKTKIAVVPNGVDTAYFSPPPERKPSKRLLFVGSMDYHANIDAVHWFVAEMWPLIAQQEPGVTFTIVGRNPDTTVKALQNARIEVTGTVPDVRPYYHDAFAVVVPLRVGSGTRLKILEAMAAGVPVVSTALGVEGIDARHQEHLLLGDTPGAIAAAVRQIRSEAELCSRLIDSARQLVLRQYDWSAVGARLFDVHRSLMLKN